MPRVIPEAGANRREGSALARNLRLSLEEFRLLHRIMGETAALPSIDHFRDALFECLHDALDVPLVAFSCRVRGRTRIAQSRDLSESELRARHPSVFREQEDYLKSPWGPQVAILGDSVPEPVLDGMATIHDIWKPNGIRDGLTASLTGPAGAKALLVLLLQDRRRMGRLTRLLQALLPFLGRHVDHFAHLETLQARLLTFEAVADVGGPVVLFGPKGGVAWMSPSARRMFQELRGRPDVPEEIRSWMQSVRSRGDQSAPSATCILLLDGRWLVLRYREIREEGIRQGLVVIEDRKSEQQRVLDGKFQELNLSGRSEEVASLVVRGRLNKEIARQLGIRLQTVKNHVRSIYDRTGARNRAELVRLLADEREV